MLGPGSGWGTAGPGRAYPNDPPGQKRISSVLFAKCCSEQHHPSVNDILNSVRGDSRLAITWRCGLGQEETRGLGRFMDSRRRAPYGADRTAGISVRQFLPPHGRWTFFLRKTGVVIAALAALLGVGRGTPTNASVGNNTIRKPLRSAMQYCWIALGFLGLLIAAGEPANASTTCTGSGSFSVSESAPGTCTSLWGGTDRRDRGIDNRR